MRTSTDVLRSISYYLSLSLGEEWEVRFEDEEGAFDRPFCRVQTSTPARSKLGPPTVWDIRQTFSAVLYPVEKPTAAEARLEAARVEDLLMLAWARGTHVASFGRKQNSGVATVNRQRGHPLRIPLYDFDGIGLMEVPTSGDRASNDFVLVTDEPTVQTLEGTSRADEEETLYVVTTEVRCKWTRSAAVLTTGVPITGVTATRTQP